MVKASTVEPRPEPHLIPHAVSFGPDGACANLRPPHCPSRGMRVQDFPDSFLYLAYARPLKLCRSCEECEKVAENWPEYYRSNHGPDGPFYDRISRKKGW